MRRTVVVSDDMAVVLTALIIDTPWDDVMRQLDSPLVRAVLRDDTERAALERFKVRLRWLRERIPATASYKSYMRGRAGAIINGA